MKHRKNVGTLDVVRPGRPERTGLACGYCYSLQLARIVRRQVYRCNNCNRSHVERIPKGQVRADRKLQL